MSYIMYYIMYNSMFNMWLFHFASLVDFTLVLCVLYRISIYADTTLAVTRSLLGPISCTVTYCIWQYLTCVWRSLGSIIWVSLFIPRDNSGEKNFSMLLEIIPIPSMPSENIPSSLVLVFDSSHATTVMFQLDIYVCTIRCCITVGLFHPWGRPWQLHWGQQLANHAWMCHTTAPARPSSQQRATVHPRSLSALSATADLAP